MTSPIWSPLSLARSSSAVMTAAPSSGAGVLPRAPPNLPTAVRAAATMTMSFMSSPVSRWWDAPEPARAAAPRLDRDAESGPRDAGGSWRFLFDVTPGRRLDRLPSPVAGGLGRGDELAAEGLEPARPVGPPAAGVLIGRGKPVFGRSRQASAVADPVAALVLQRRVDDAGNVAGSAEHEAALALEDLGASIGARPRHDVVFARRVDVGRRVDATEIDPFTTDDRLAGLDQVVFEVGVAQAPAVHRTRQVGAVAVPVQQVERRRCLALQVVADDVVPDQVVRAKKAEGRRQLPALEQIASTGALGPQRHFAHSHHAFVDEDVEYPGVAEVEEGGEQRHALGGPLTARSEHRKCGCQDSSADAKTERVDPLLAGDLLHQANGADRRLVDVVVPRFLRDLFARILPADDEDTMALGHRVADQRVLGLQVEDVELVDARRHHEQRALEHLVGERLVFEQLEQLVL